MSAYLLGIATIPAILVGGYLLTATGAWLITRLGRLHLGVLRRIRPEETTAAERRAAIVFGLKRGALFSRGEFVIIVGYGLDEDRRNEHRRRMLREFKRPEVTP